MQVQTFSKKDGQLIQQIFKSIIDSYYENSCPETELPIIALNNLIIESITSTTQIDTQQIIPKLQVLKIKARSNQNLRSSIIKAIQHLKKPTSVPLKHQTIQQCMKFKQLIEVCCTIVQRLKKKLKQMDQVNVWKVFKTVGCNGQGFPGVMVQTLVEIINNYRNITIQSGIVEVGEFICKQYLKKCIKDKVSTQKCLKLIVNSCKFSPTLIQSKQSTLSSTLYHQPTTVLQIQDLLNFCYNQSYCSQFLSSIKQQNIDTVYLWSCCSIFCTESRQQNITQLQQMLKNKSKVQTQVKIYTILTNFMNVNGDLNIRYVGSLPNNLNERVYSSYLNYILNLVQNSHNSVGKNLKLEQIQKICEQYKFDTDAVKKLIRNIKQNLINTSHPYVPNPTTKKKQGKNQTSSQNIFDILLAKANKIPKNDQDLKTIHEILIYQSKTQDPYQKDNIRSLKNRALDSLKISLMLSQNLYYEKIYNFFDLSHYDSETLNKLLQIANHELKTNPKAASAIDVHRLAKVILRINQKDHYFINFQQLGQIFNICLGEQQWDRSKYENKNKQQWKLHILQRLRALKLGQPKVKKDKTFEDVIDMIGRLVIHDQHHEDEQIIVQQINQKMQEAAQTIKQISWQKLAQMQESQMIAENHQQQSQTKQQKIQEQQKKEKIKQEKIQQIKQQQKKIKQQKIQEQKNLQQQKAVQKIQKSQKTNNTKAQNSQNKQKQQNGQQNKQILIKPNPIIEIKKQVQQPKFQPQKSPQTVKPLVQQKLKIKLILKYKIKQGVKRWLKRAKKSKQRLYILKQWADTQKTYRQKLFVLRDQIRNPLLKSQLINELQAAIIFPNIDSMIVLCKQMNSKIRQIIQKWNPIKTQLSPCLKSITNFLKIYKNYSESYNKSYEMLKRLAQNPKYSQCVKLVGLDNYLFSPVQRFQKYHLFVSNYLKNLPKDHHDYKTLSTQLQRLLKVTDQINQYMEQQMRSKKMIEVQKKFGNIVSNARQFKIEFFANNFQNRCKIYVFNDLIIVAKLTQHNTEQLYMRIKLCGKSIVIQQPDCKSFKNRLYICGMDTGIHLTFQTSAQSQNIYKFIHSLIQKIYQNEYKRYDMISQAQSKLKQQSLSTRSSRFQLNIQLLQSVYHILELSAEIVGLDKIHAHGILQTYFIIKFKVSKPYEIYQIAYCQLGVIDELQKHVNLIYPKIKTPSLQIKSKQVSTQDLAKVNQYLCVTIQKFLNFILRNKTIAKKPQLILYKLGLHQCIWAILNINNQQLQCSCQLCLHSQIFTDIGYYQKQKKLINAKQYSYCPLYSLQTQNTMAVMVNKKIFMQLNIEYRLKWANCYLKRIDHSLQHVVDFGKKVNFKVHVRMLSDNIVLDIKNATVYTNARQVINQICKRLGIYTTMDLALVFSQDEQQLVLEDDQILYNYVKLLIQAQQYQRKLQQSSNLGRFSLFDRLSWNSQSSNKKFKILTLSLRKIIYFNHTLQQKQCIKNPQRFNFIIGDILRKYQNFTLVLSQEQTRLLCGLLYTIENFSSLVVQKKVFFKQDKLKKYIPQSQWSIITPEFIDKVIHVVVNQITKTENITTILCNLMRTYWKKYSIYYFLLQNMQPSTLLGNYKSLLFGVNYKKATVMRKQGINSLLEYAISTFKYRVYAGYLYIETVEKIQYFKGNNLFIFNKIIQIYRTLYSMENQDVVE